MDAQDVIIIAHFEHFVLRWAKKIMDKYGDEYEPAIWFSILQYNVQLIPLHCTKAEDSNLNSSWKNCETNFQCLKTEEKVKWTDKGMFVSLHPNSQSNNTKFKDKWVILRF